MKAICTAKKLPDLINGKIYDILRVETVFESKIMYRVVDESGEDYLYSERAFRVIED